MAKIKIKDLKLRTIIGVDEWEKKKKQDVVINIAIGFDGSKAGETDDLKDTVDYKTMKLQILKLVENSNFNLIEKMASEILKICMSDPKVENAAVEVDKPHALRFAESVSVTVSDSR